ncbi:hypothetical protein BP6252_07633 [Coleophoma cylindrospora]|uniref:Zn(2)-C6 fungal-type domain-containing protein n=1 Tax=Coleophoma cylindrospora TaxID=1849047 RepID=A0A3D8RAR4_9HELO|nr:hypothetical protein BP6252_07633 [Coleophoma cylindrospora]
MANKIKKTKTYTGCWTCRARRVKCGQEKPACLRCRNALLSCKGYQAALTWPDSERAKGRQRMLVLDQGSERHWHVMSPGALWSALTTLDSVPRETSLTIGLFGVFPVSRNSAVGSETEPMNSSASTHLCSSNTSHEKPDKNKNAILKPSSIHQDLTRAESDPIKTQKLDNNKYSGSSSILRVLNHAAYHLEAPLQNPLPIKSREGRQLMHYWITYLSHLMLPVPSDENPFQTLMIPLALSAAEQRQDSAGTSTLLYSLYAVAAISQENRSSGQTKQHGVLSAKYLQFSFHYLRRSLSEPNPDHPEAILSAIIMLLLTSIFNEEATDWRVHLRGAFTWLQTVGKSTWKSTREASRVYEIFLNLEAFRPAHPALALELEPWNPNPQGAAEAETAGEPNQRMMSVFGITQPVFECIIEINSLIYSGREPPARVLQALERKIRDSVPQRSDGSGQTAQEQLAHLHARVGHVATELYFSRGLRREPLGKVQGLVRQSVELLDRIMRLAAGQNLSGLLWPAFMTGCEADEAESRGRIEAYFDDREALGIGNVTDARTVIREVWQRRDKAKGLVDVKWHEVMLDLGINILLS